MNNNGNTTGGRTYDQVFRAIGDPHRIRIVQLLQEKEMSAGEILEALDIVQSTLSHHMKSLVDAGAVNSRRHGKWTYYSLNAEVMAEAAAFLGTLAGGTKLRMNFEAAPGTSAPDEAQGTSVKTAPDEVKGASAKTAPDEAQRASNHAAPKEQGVMEKASSSGKEEKKKSKKGKKGKKNKK